MAVKMCQRSQTTKTSQTIQTWRHNSLRSLLCLICRRSSNRCQILDTHAGVHPLAEQRGNVVFISRMHALRSSRSLVLQYHSRCSNFLVSICFSIFNPLCLGLFFNRLLF